MDRSIANPALAMEFLPKMRLDSTAKMERVALGLCGGVLVAGEELQEWLL